MARKTSQEVVTVPLQSVTPIQQTFIEHLLQGKSISDAALSTGISRRTATYWLHDQEHAVTIEYEKQVMQLYQAHHERMENLHNLALKAVEDALSEEAPGDLRLKAARFIIENRIGRASLPSTPFDLVESMTKSMSARYHLDTYDAHHLGSVPD